MSESNKEALRRAANAIKARNRAAVLEACRRPGVWTGEALAKATGLNWRTCLALRAELAAAGLVERTWSGGGGGRGIKFGLTDADREAIRERTAKVRAAKRLYGGSPLPLDVLAQVLPS